MSKQTSAQDLAGHLFEAEAAIGAALAKAALLTESLVFCQRDLNFSPVVGHRAIDGMGAAMSALASANSQMASVHRRLDEIRTKMGIDPAVAYGGGEKPPVGLASDAVAEEPVSA
jgi:hypothetical protein